MIFGINKNDSTPKTAAKAGIAGATVGAGAIAMSKIRPAMKNAFKDSIKQQKEYIENFDKYVSTTKGLENLTPMQKINKYIGGKLKSAVDLNVKNVYKTCQGFESKMEAATTGEAKKAVTEKLVRFANGADKMIENGTKKTIKELGEEKTVLMNGKPSKYIAGKKAIGKTAAKIGSKFEKMGDAIHTFMKSESKKAFLKDNKANIKNGLKKYGLPVLIATIAATGAAIIAKTIANKKEAKNQ